MDFTSCVEGVAAFAAEVESVVIEGVDVEAEVIEGVVIEGAVVEVEGVVIEGAVVEVEAVGLSSLSFVGFFFFFRPFAPSRIVVPRTNKNTIIIHVKNP
jgi:hypothetical protein